MIQALFEEQMKREGSNQAYSIWTEVEETSPNLALEHAKIVRDAATLRNIEAAGARAVQIANDPDAMGDVNAALAKARQALENVTTGAGSIQPASSILPAVIDTISRLANGQEMPGIPTRFDCLDTILQGLKRGDLTILAARPAMGKTALALNIARNVLSMDRNVAIFSVEMTGEQLLLRMLAAETAIDSLRLQSGDLSEEEWVFLLEAANNLAESGLYLDDKSFTVADLLHQARQLHREVGLDLVIVDYLQLLDGGALAAKGNRQQEISQISRALKRMARELNIPVLALSQLSRAVESMRGIG